MNRLCIKNFKNYIKVMEVPDKIYVGIDPIWGNMYVNYDKNDIDNIEYIRKDTFIKKADEFISTFFHPDDTDLIDAVLNRFHEHINLK